MITDKLLSAVIRKDMKEVYALILDEAGLTEGAIEVRGSSRMTKALVDRTSLKPEEAEEPTYCDDGFDDVREAITNGKRKKALKLIKAHKENGSKGSVLSGLKKQAKEL